MQPSWFLAIALALWPCAVAAQPMTKAQEELVMDNYQQHTRAVAAIAAGNLQEAEAIFAEGLAILLREMPDEALFIAAQMHSLASVRADMGHLDAAEDMARESLAMREAAGAVTTALASSQVLLASILRDQSRKREALPLLTEAVNRTLNDPEANRSHLVADFTALAVLTAELGEHAEAASLMAQLEPYLDSMAPADQARVFQALGRVNSLAGQPQRAEAAYREAVRRSQDLHADPDWTNSDRATATGNLASILLQQGRPAEAEPLFNAALAALGPGGPVLVRANLLAGLGQAARAQGRFQAAFDAHRTALDLRLAALTPAHPAVAASFAAAGEAILQAGDAETARAALHKAATLAHDAGDRLAAGRAGLSLAMAEQATGNDGLPTAQAALQDLQAVLAEGHPELVRAGFSTAWIALGADKPDVALPLARAAVADYARLLSGLGADATLGAIQNGDMRRQIMALPAAAFDVDAPALIDEAFRAAQWSMLSRAARATQRMAARTAAGSDDLAALVRGKQDLVNLWAETDRAYIAALSADPDAARASTAALRDLEARLEQSEAQIAAAFPDYARLVEPGVMGVPEAQALLQQDEALLVIITTQDETFVFALRADRAAWHRAPLGEAALAAAVGRLRADLDPTGPARSAVALDGAAPPTGGQPFDFATAEALHAALVQPAAPLLAGASRVLVVADGPISVLPLAMLPRNAPTGPDALTQADWLVRHHALATLPAVSSLAALRSRPAGLTAQAGTGFAGFGDPVFAGQGEVLALSRYFAGDRAQAQALRALPPLPGTRREVMGLAALLGPADTQVHLGADATETAVKAADFSRAGTIAFATHGLIAGDISGLSEPALALTPPATPGAMDDGLLTASEAALLDLRADWVILSACNTAAGDGTPGAEGLSGLASAFLYAGARGLLVSHWPVGDRAAAALTQGAVRRLAADPGMGQAEALRQSMLEVMAEPGMAHPSVWAPFVIVGDGT